MSNFILVLVLWEVLEFPLFIVGQRYLVGIRVLYAGTFFP